MKTLSILPTIACTSLVLLLLSSCFSSSALRQTQELQGKLREAGSAPFPLLLLVTPQQKHWEMIGPLREELQSLVGMEVKVIGQETERGVLYPRFTVERYEILSAGVVGERPLVGVVEAQQGEVWLRSPTLAAPLRLTGPLLSQIQKLVGKQIWVVGEPDAEDRVLVTRFGIIR